MVCLPLVEICFILLVHRLQRLVNHHKGLLDLKEVVNGGTDPIKTPLGQCTMNQMRQSGTGLQGQKKMNRGGTQKVQAGLQLNLEMGGMQLICQKKTGLGQEEIWSLMKHLVVLTTPPVLNMGGVD